MPCDYIVLQKAGFVSVERFSVGNQHTEVWAANHIATFKILKVVARKVQELETNHNFMPILDGDVSMN